MASQQVITVKVISKVPWKSDLSNDYPIQANVTIRQFCESIGIKWDVEALVFVNDEIAHESQVLKHDDQVLLMIPVVGG